MSVAPIRSRFSRKTLAIALAAGVSFGGVQVVNPGGTILSTPVAHAENLDTKTVNVGDGRSARANLFNDGLYYLGAVSNHVGRDTPNKLLFTSDASRDNLQAAFFLNSTIIRNAGFDPNKPVTLTYGNSDGTVDADNILDGIELYKGQHGTQGMTKLNMSPATNSKAASIELRFDNGEEYAGYVKDVDSNLMISDPVHIKQGDRSVYLDKGVIDVVADKNYELRKGQKLIPGETYELATLTAHYNLTRLLESGQLKAQPTGDSSPGVWTVPDGKDKLKVMYKVPEDIKTTQQLSLQTSWTFTGPRRSNDMNLKHSETANFTFDVTVGSDALDNQPTYPITTVKPGETSTVDPTSFKHGAEYKINDANMKLPSGWSAPKIDAKTGTITVNAPKTAKTGDFIDVPLTVTYPDGTVDNETIRFTVNEKEVFVSNVKKLDNGDYEITRNDNTKWTINLSDLNKRIKALEDKDTVSPEDFKKVQDDLKKAQDGINGLKGKDAKTDKTLGELKDQLNKLEPRVKNLEDRVTKLEGSVIKEVVKNDDGSYTLIREDDTAVPGNIDASGAVTDIKTDGKGNLIVTINGKEKPVPLDQVKITEKNKGTKDHTVTITTPDDQSVTFNVFDNYVTDVIKQENGDYKVIRNDGTEWTIELKDIRDKIAALEAKDSPSRDEFNKVKQELADLNSKVDAELKNIDNRFTKVEGDITNLRADLTNLENRVAKIEGRLTILEGRTDDLTKCVAGAGAAAIPAMLAIPLMMMTQLNIPGIKDLNTQVQKQIGMYNPDLARAWERNGGVLQAGAALATLAGMIGGIAYLAKQCDPMMKTPAGQDTDLGKLSSKLDKGSAKIKEGSSSKKNAETKPEAEQPAENVDAPAEAEQPAEQPAENADAEIPVEAEAPAEVDAPEAEAEAPATE